ncbi:hypothetical protein Gste01_02946 [Geobacillus stearothermophilus ATCC 7953]
MEQSFRVEKALNNNVLIAFHSQYGEVVLLGKGIGFGKKRGMKLRKVPWKNVSSSKTNANKSNTKSCFRN